MPPVDGTDELLLHRLFARACRRFPERTAVVAGRQRLSYAQLDAASDQLAQRLIAAGTGPGVPVAVLVDKERVESAVAVVAIWKAGGCYLPIDPATPTARIHAMLTAAEPAVLIGGAEDSAPHAELVGRVEPWLPWWESGEAPCPPRTRVSPDDLAYLVHTSGSTGLPKPVAVSHRALATIYHAWAHCYQLAPEPRVHLQAAGPAFDVHVGDIARALLSGGCLVLCPKRVLLDPPSLADLIAANGVDTVEFTPAVLRLFASWLAAEKRATPSLRLLISGGERWTVRDYQAVRATFGPRVSIVNSYGVAEAAIDSTWCEVDDGLLRSLPDGSVPIGRPFPGVHVRVLDRTGRDVGDGETGELWLGGATLAAGYHRRPDLTAERFVAAPDVPGGRLYRTGDLVRRVGGMLVHIGRADDEVKVRGVRVQPAAVEATLAAHEAVQAAVVARHEQAGEAVLIAHVVARSDEEPQALADRLRRHCAETLPDAMVPAEVIRHDRLPLTPSGKVDRDALRRSRGGDEQASADGTSTEELLVAAWTRLIGRPPRDLDEDLFEAGGSSLTAALLAVAVRERTGAWIPMAAVFAAPTIRALVRAVHDQARADTPLPASDAEGGPLDPEQRRLWLLHQIRPDDPTYNLPTLLHVDGPLKTDVLREAFTYLVARHEALRTAFENGPDGPVMRVLSQVREEWEVVDAASDTAASVVEEIVRRPFDLGLGQVVRAAVVRHGADRFDLLLVVHHIAFDGWSERILVEELGAVYNALLAARKPDLPEPAVRPLDLSARRNARLVGEPGDTQRAYWRERFADPVPTLPLPVRDPGPETATPRAATLRRELGPVAARAVSETAAARRTTEHVVMLAAFALLLSRWSGRRDLVVGVPYGDRDLPETQRLVGFDVATLPLRFSVAPETDFDTLLREVQSGFTDALANSEIPYDEIVQQARGPETEQAPLFRAWFNWLGRPLEPPSMAGLRVTVGEPPIPGALFDLSMYVTRYDSGHRIDLVYDADRFDEAITEEFADQYLALVAAVCAAPGEPVGSHRLAAPEPAWPDLRDDVPDLLAGLTRVATASARETAVVGPELELSYAELYARAGAFCAAVTAAGAGPGTTVGIYAARTLELVPALLGVLGAGAAFTILDAKYPAARLAAQCRSADVSVALAVGADAPTELRATVPDWPAVPADAQMPWPSAPSSPETPAYVAFTSGTTGEPRAVVGSSRPLAHFLHWYVSAHAIGPADRFAMLSGLGHDPLLRDVFTPLWTGATLCVPPAGLTRASRELREWLAVQRVTIAHVTPAMCRLVALARQAPVLTDLRLVCCSGDALTAADVAAIRHWAPRAVVVHGYGTTETPQLVSARVLDPGEPQSDPVTIAAGAPGAEVLVLDRYGRRAAVGELGAVVVRSPYLALSAGARGEQAEVFAPDPVPGHRRFATGDLGRYHSQELIALAGRGDDQAKILGIRTEPAEIDRALLGHPAVRDAAAAVRRGPDGAPRLIAYVVPAADGPAPSVESVRAFLRVRLPEHMLPVAVVPIPRIPLTPNGKTDRAALPAPPPATPTPAAGPQTELERLVAEVWARLLGVDSVPVDRTFFALGASSLLIARAHQELEETLAREFPVAALFEHTGVRALAAYLSGAVSSTPARYRREPVTRFADLRSRRLAARASARLKESNA
ncbi:amino acid adenylation domain-containing protein [Streptomyces sp. NPDC007856]|uniref:amino acid adenylation domain-containing protein n=1 Tax=Streptomyces sp. NPDC007856 TaxID=3364781 RepID=UPI0036B1B099